MKTLINFASNVEYVYMTREQTSRNLTFKLEYKLKK